MSSKNFYGLTGDVTVDGGILNVGNAQLYANTETSNVGIGTTNPLYDLHVIGNANVVNLYASYVHGDGSKLTGIAASLDQIVDQGNLVSNTIQLISGQDPVSNVGLVTHEGVGISVSNTTPTGEYQFGVGSNLLVNVYSSNVVTVSGNVLAEKMTLGTITVRPSYNLSHVTAEGSSTGDTISLTNATTGLSATANVLVGGELDVEGNVHVGERLKFDSNVFVDSLRIADLAANLVTYDAATGELFDSAGLFANKLAVVSEQPPVALTGGSTSVSGHGTYTIEASSGTDTYLFDKNNTTVWQTGETYGEDGVYGGLATLAGTGGEWAKITFPYKTILRHVKFESTNSSIKDLTIVGLNDDGTTWTTLKNVTNLSAANSTIIVDASTRHATYGFIITATNVGKTQAEIGDLRLFAESFSIDGGKVDMTVSSISTITANLEVGTSNLFVDTTSGKVGIGKTDPTTALDVVGETKISSNLEVGTSNLFVDTTTGKVGVGVNNPKESLDIRGNMHLTRVSNVSQISVDSNVVTEYTGPHDRPLRKYPEVALTANSDSGYVASTNNKTTGTSGVPYRDAFMAYDGSFTSMNATWQTLVNSYDSNGDDVNGDTFTVGSTNYVGHWNKLQLPNPIKVDKIEIIAYVNGTDDQRPEQGAFLGSTDGTNWELVYSFSSGTLGWSESGDTSGIRKITTITDITNTNKYNYLILVVEKIPSSSTATQLGVAEIRYYGYEEGSGSLDTTLKSVYNVPATTGTQLEVYYDAKGESTVQSPIPDLSPNTNTGAVSGHSPTLDSTDGIDSFKFNGSSQYVTGTHGLTTGSDPVHTISLWFKRTAKVNQFDYLVQLGEGGTSHQQSAIFIDDDKIGHGHWGGGVYQTDVITDNVWYHVAATFTGGNTSDLSTHKIYVNGVEKGINAYSSDGPLVLTGTALTLGRNEDALGSPGGYFNGSIANFRLYSKALNADQVKELYDYQKDYFLGSKSQLTIYKGHLGVGVTEPSGQLELAGDERIQEYPPRALTNHSTYIEGHGVFKVYGSKTTYNPWSAFNDTTDVWYTETVSEYNGDYSGSTQLAPETVKGEYLILEMPYEIVIKQTKFWQQIGGSHVWDRGVYYAKRNSSDEWTPIHNVTDRPADDDTPYVAYITDPNPYKYFAIVPTRRYTAHATNGVSIRDFQIFGTPGPTTLDKGSLTLGRSLDVPRVSRYDVDTETPRPEKLVVDFDTTVNSSPTDISGKGNHGAFKGTAQYSPADKAFVFDGTSGCNISGTHTLSGTSPAHSMSVWFKRTAVVGSYDYVLAVGTSANSQNSAIVINNNQIWFSIFGDEIISSSTIVNNVWYHLTLTFNGGIWNNTNCKMYLNGEPITTTSGSSGTLNLTGNQVTLGTNSSNGEEFNGMISNFKLYDVALEPSEVKKLYNLGRTGRSMVISDTAVGIGKVPEAQLDVRGSAIFGGTLDVHGTGIHVNGTVLREYSSIGAVTAGTWYKVCDFRVLPASRGGVCVIRIHWGGGASSSGTQYWSGYASGIVVYNTYNDGSGIYTSAPREPLTLTQQYHHRVGGAFEFGLDGDGSNGSYGYQSLYIKSPVSLTSLGLQVNAIPLRH